MSNPDDGGPAFAEFRPIFDKQGWIVGYRDQKSMSLRDWFAGMALSGWETWLAANDRNADAEVVARFAYDVADAMLLARKKKGGEHGRGN